MSYKTIQKDKQKTKNIWKKNIKKKSNSREQKLKEEKNMTK